MSQRYNYSLKGDALAGLDTWGSFLGNVLKVEGTVAENSTARLQGVGQWIWPVTLGLVAIVVAFVWLKKGK